MIMRNNPKQVDVVIYLKSSFFSGKVVDTDIEISENKKNNQEF